jgi:hypothetical protein
MLDQIFLPVFVAIFMTFAASGVGIMLLSILGCRALLVAREVSVWAFAIGSGVLGWVVFIFGLTEHLTSMELSAFLIFCSIGNVFFLYGKDSEILPLKPESWGRLHYLLIAVVVFVLFGDVLEAFSPAADGDSLAYHFALPKNILAAGHLVFVPRAVDATSPLLVNMAYIPPLALGGERALNLWLMISGWACAAFIYVVCLRYLSAVWSILAALIFLTTPAVLYSAGTGQVEVRLALFVLVAAFSILEVHRHGSLNFVILAGLAAGFFAGGKYTGLLFVVACGLSILYNRSWLKHGLLFGAAALIAGGQWYIWNWVNIGDPVFPMLYPILGVIDASMWDAIQHAYFEDQFFGSERGVSRNLFWFFAYPFKATFDALPQFDARRIGLGVFCAISLPFVILSIWEHRRKITSNPLVHIGVIVFIFYALWFFTGSSQRVRHLLPIFPLLFILFFTASGTWAVSSSRKAQFAIALVFILAIQIGGQALVSMKFARFLFSDETRVEFLNRNVSKFSPVPWINTNLKNTDLVVHNIRSYGYLLNPHSYLAIPSLQKLINTRPDATAPENFMNELVRLGATHILLIGSLTGADFTTEERHSPFYRLTRKLYGSGCVTIVRTFKVKEFSSRTLPTLGKAQGDKADMTQLFKVLPEKCILHENS